MEESKLFELGLNRNEAKVYLILLKLGRASAGELIKKTELHRNIIYDNLDKLIDKGLVTFVSEGNKKVFQTASPEMISEVLDKEQERLNKKKLIAEEIKKEVIKIKSLDSQKQEATIFRGIKGIKALLNDTLKEHQSYLVIGAPQSSLDILGESFWKNHNLNRVERKMEVKMLFNEELKAWSKSIISKHTQVRYLPKRFDGLTETIIYADKVAFIVWTDKPIATLIKDEHLADNYRKYFLVLWEQGKS